MKNLCRLIQDFIAVDVIDGTVLRNQETGVVGSIQQALRKIDLSSIPDECAYEAWLDRQTDMVLSQLVVMHPPWGTARKAVNLFMRACIRDYELREQFNLHIIEEFAEIPLDSVVARALKREAAPAKLPAWNSLKRLKKQEHKQFQVFGNQLAQKEHMPRVYLDNRLWLGNR